MTSAENPAKDLLAIKQLFDQCMAVDSDKRTDFLTKSHCTDAQIAQVKRMLTVADETQHSGQDIQIINRQMQDFSQKLEQGQQLDNYQIEKEIGRGGMGIVFLAHRADGSYEQKVAIKITPSFASQQELQRFHLERQILAQLQHPNIAMLLDGGSTPDNRPYLVMEYVEGESITHYAATHKLTLKQRLILFSDVCDAVSFAHSCLIVHRDIKPENVLVTQEGKVKLLDFGVSKILQSDQHSTKTTLQQGLTLSYASPEQVKGETTTTATDVYGLGALLYELLAGQVPHHLNNASNEEIIQHICLTEPVRPSKTVKSTNHPIQYQTLKGDLDNITNKALRKEPLRRYASVRDLSLDIDRYLKGQAVLATPAGFAYKVSKFINRHPAATGLAGALVVALLGGLMISIDLTRQLTVEREQLTEERDRLVLTQQQLQQEAQTSKQVINLLTDMFNAASPNNARGKDISVTKLISTAVEQTQTALTDQPKVKSRLLSTLSMVQNNIGQEKEALSLLQQAMEIKNQQGIAPTIAELANLADLYRLTGDLDNAQTTLQQAQLLADSASSEASTALLNRHWANYYYEKSEHAKALEYLWKVQQYWKIHPQQNTLQSLGIQEQFARIYITSLQFERALDILESVLAQRTNRYGADHASNIKTLSTLADTYRMLNRNEDAGRANKRAYQLGSSYFDPNHTSYYHTVTTYALYLKGEGKLLEAKALFNKEIKPNLNNQRSLGLYLTFRAAIDLKLGNYPQALDDLQRAKAILTPIYKGSLLYMYNTQLNLALVLGLSGKPDIANQQLNQLYKEGSKAWGDKSLPMSSVKINAAFIAITSGEYAKAKQDIDFAQSIFDNNIDKKHIAQLDTLSAYVELYRAQALWSEALNFIEKNLQLLATYHSINSIETMLMQLKKAEALWQLGDKKQAASLITNNAEPLLQKLTPQSVYYQYIETLQEQSTDFLP